MLCSDCFADQGLKLDAARIGILDDSACSKCGATTGRKLNKKLITRLAHRFFVWGTLHRCEFGGAPVVQFNDVQSTSINAAPWLEPDLRLIENALGVGFFYYDPPLWMIGEIEPLKALQDTLTRATVVDQVLADYPTVLLTTDEIFYRIRKDPGKPIEVGEYDSPPIEVAGSGRLDSKDFPVMYGSQDLKICVHECRVTAEDELYVATLAPTRDLRLLDLTELLQDEGVTAFESLDLARIIHERAQDCWRA